MRLEIHYYFGCGFFFYIFFYFFSSCYILLSLSDEVLILTVDELKVPCKTLNPSFQPVST